VVVVETTVDENGRASRVDLVRGPSHCARRQRRGDPGDPPGAAAQADAARGHVKFTEIWLVTRTAASSSTR
jgi:hypothetical protein